MVMSIPFDVTIFYFPPALTLRVAQNSYHDGHR